MFKQMLQQAQAEPVRAEAQFWLAETYQLRGEMQAALAAYRRPASDFSQQHVWALTALCRAAEIYETLQQFRKAINLYEQVMPPIPTSRGSRGRI